MSLRWLYSAGPRAPLLCCPATVWLTAGCPLCLIRKTHWPCLLFFPYLSLPYPPPSSINLSINLSAHAHVPPAPSQLSPLFPVCISLHVFFLVMFMSSQPFFLSFHLHKTHFIGVPVNSRVSNKIQQLLNTLKRPKRPPLREFFVDDFEELLDGKPTWM